MVSRRLRLHSPIPPTIFVAIEGVSPSGGFFCAAAQILDRQTEAAARFMILGEQQLLLPEHRTRTTRECMEPPQPKIQRATESDKPRYSGITTENSQDTELTVAALSWPRTPVRTDNLRTTANVRRTTTVHDLIRAIISGQPITSAPRILDKVRRRKG